LIHCICLKLHCQSGMISFAQSIPDFRFILTDLEDALKKCVPRESLKQYRTKRNEYNRRFDEYRASITVNQNNEANNQSLISDVNQRVHVNIQLRAELSHALIELAEESEHPLCLFIDGYERISEADPE